METGHTQTWLASLTQRQQAFDELSTIIAGEQSLKRLKLLEVLKLGNGRQVFLVRWNGEKAVLKRFLTGFDTPPFVTVGNLQQELDHLAPRMSDGPYQINRCLLARLDLGFAVVSFAKGKRMTDAMSASNPGKRARLMRESGHWLAYYTADRRREKVFGPRHWVDQRAAMDLSDLSESDQKLLEKLMVALRRWAVKTQGAPVMQAAIHGDFSGLNLHIQAGILTGVDVQGTCWQALSRDVARFLVWQQIWDKAALPNDNYGINQADWQAFLSSGVLPAQEYGTTLPFFIGDRLFGSLVLDHGKEQSAEPARTAINAFISQSP